MLKLALMIISVDLLLALGEFRRIRLQQSVSKKDILSVEKTSVTQCHLNCHSMSACVGYGSQNMDSGELFVNCYLLKRGYHSPLNGDERIQLDVVAMVGGGILFRRVRWELSVPYCRGRYFTKNNQFFTPNIPCFMTHPLGKWKWKCLVKKFGNFLLLLQSREYLRSISLLGTRTST